MNILFGHYVADEGERSTPLASPLPKGDPHAALAAGVGMVHQHFTLADQMSGAGEHRARHAKPARTEIRPRQGVRAGASLRWRDDFGLRCQDPERDRSADLSVGERQRVEILKALYRNARILILDEPTAVLTPLETEALFRDPEECS